MKQGTIYQPNYTIKCLWCGKVQTLINSFKASPCECVKEDTVNVDLRMVEKQVQELNGDVYLMSKTIESMNESIKDLMSKYELLLNRIKCIDCQGQQNKKE